MKKVLLSMVVAFVLWTMMFSPLTAPYMNFWWAMTASAVTLTALATSFAPRWWERLRFSFADVFLGVAVAIALWGVFWLGDKVSQLLFDFARPQVDTIYGMKEGFSPLLLTLLLLCIIGPAEEIFWRGYVQETLSRRWGDNCGFVVATIVYAVVHVASMNFMLIMAALVAGLVWGVLYRLFPERFTAIIISHAVWDAAVFVWFPIM
ncbi:MAG: CPBP family intramembrane metalloprotease [Bacteroidaceae bacterium]|nr:CPBP family intramembrane metalloprotease [Bacteroidaceae bacterium]